MAYVNFKNSPSEETPLTGGATGNLNVMQENGTSHGTDTKLGYAQSFLNEHIINVSNEVDEDYRVNFLKSKNIIDSTNFQSGAISASTGQKVDYGTRVCTINKIPVKSSTKYAITIDTTTSYSFLMIVDAYNESGTYLGRISNQNGNTDGTYVETQSTAKYINITLRDTTDSQVLSATLLQYLLNGSLKAQIEEGDTATSYEPYITPSIYVDNEMLVSKNVYSSGEVVIGEWLGKPLYRKVIDFGSLPNATNKSVNHNISNIDKIVNQSVIADNGSQFNSIPYLSYTTLANGINFYSTKTLVNIGTGYNWSAYSAYVILEYTKTTD